MQIAIVSCLIVFAIGIDSRSITSTSLGFEENNHPNARDFPIAFERKYSGTRWGRSIKPEDLREPENRQQTNDEDLISSSLLKHGTESASKVVIPDEHFQITESRYKKRHTFGNYGDHRGTLRRGRSVEEDFIMASRKKRPGYSGTHWGR